MNIIEMHYQTIILIQVFYNQRKEKLTNGLQHLL